MVAAQVVAEQEPQASAPKKRRGRTKKGVEAPSAPAAETPTTPVAARRPMGDEHKAALAEGRESGRAIRQYLEAIETNRPRRGRRRTSESIEKRLAQIEESIGSVDSLTRLHLVQERMDLQTELVTVDMEPDLSEYEAAFIAHAAGYSERKGISYAAWREIGVPRNVLREAGIER